MRKKAVLLLGIILLITLSVMSGCNFTPDNKKENIKKTGVQVKPAEKVKVILYFSDQDAMYLVPESRTVEVKDKNNTEMLAKAIVEQLIKGPQNPDLVKTVPPEARVLSVKIADNIAQVNFSEEISTKHWGGSTGESMTISSIVDSLTELQSIKQVQILIAGKKAETLAGHLDITQPLDRNEDMIKK